MFNSGSGEPPPVRDWMRGRIFVSAIPIRIRSRERCLSPRPGALKTGAAFKPPQAARLRNSRCGPERRPRHHFRSRSAGLQWKCLLWFECEINERASSSRHAAGHLYLNRIQYSPKIKEQKWCADNPLGTGTRFSDTGKKYPCAGYSDRFNVRSLK